MTIHTHPFELKTRSLLCLLHGIMTRHSNVSWPDIGRRIAVEQRPDLITYSERYFAGPFPRLTSLLTNRRITRRWMRQLDQYPLDIPIHLAAHSNGCVIAMRMADQLVKMDRRIETVTLMQAALPSCPDTLHKRYPHAMGVDGPAIEAWCSNRDWAVGRWVWPFQQLRWPWGDLGSQGLQGGDLPRFKTVMDNRHNHSSRTRYPHVLKTMRDILARIPERTAE